MQERLRKGIGLPKTAVSEAGKGKSNLAALSGGSKGPRVLGL